jgi:hypothetical protein
MNEVEIRECLQWFCSMMNHVECPEGPQVEKFHEIIDAESVVSVDLFLRACEEAGKIPLTP